MDPAIGIIAFGAVVAGFVQGLSGFAFALVAMSIWAWSVELHLAAVLVVFGSLVGQIVGAVSVPRRFDLRLLAPFLIGGLAGIPLGVALLPHVDVVLFKGILGMILVVWCPLMLVSGRLPRLRFGGRAADGAIGVIGGIMGGLGGFTGVIPTLWCALRGLDKATQRSIIQNFNLVTLGATMAAYLVTGAVRVEMLPLFAIVGAAVLVPALLGARLYVGISETAFRKIVLTLLSASGVALLASSVPRLLARL